MTFLSRPSPAGTTPVADAQRADSGGPLRRAFGWHPPLMALAGACLVLLVGCVVGIAVDDRVLTGARIWDKPAKFALSIAIYSFTLAWLISLMPRAQRLGRVVGTISAVMLAGELIAIVLQVVRGRTSHFDFATPLDAAIYQAMAVMIATLWLADVVLVAWLLRRRVDDLALTWALRLGLLIAVIGMGLAYLMTLPTTPQRQSWAAGGPVTVVGAHTVGLADGGPGLPVLGWSTVGGDLRVPHFVGLHGLQVMILVALGLTALARRYPVLSAESTRVRLVVLTFLACLAMVALLTWQALRGQSVVHPDGATLAVAAVIIVVTVVGFVATLRFSPGDRAG